MSANVKSTKMISIMNDKMVQDKTKEERRKAIQSKFEFRR
jgi:anionic cell wall polymer biosynthesis LytR-Cps2A-Psr (LCP) family protein